MFVGIGFPKAAVDVILHSRVFRHCSQGEQCVQVVCMMSASQMGQVSNPGLAVIAVKCMVLVQGEYNRAIVTWVCTIVAILLHN